MNQCKDYQFSSVHLIEEKKLRNQVAMGIIIMTEIRTGKQ